MLKKLSLVTAVLVILGVALWFAQGKFSSTSDGAENQTILSSLDTEKLSSVLIQSDAEQKVELIKDSNGQWWVKGANYAADSQKIRELFLKLLDTKLGEEVTDQAKHHARFHLVHVQENQAQWEAEKTGTLLVLNSQEGTPVLELLLGKPRQENRGQYIRYANQPAVYLIGEDIQAEPDDAEWINTTLTNIDADTVKGVELKKDGETFQFVREKEGDSWQAQGVLENETLNESTVQTLANALQYLEFDNLLAADTAASQTGREAVVDYVAELFDGRLVKIQIGETAAEEDNYYLTIEMALPQGVTDEALQAQVEAFNQRSKPWLYGVQSWIGDRFLKGRDDLIVKEEQP